MNKGAQFIRLLYINYVMAKHGMDRVVFSTRRLMPLRFLSYLNPWNWLREKGKTRAESVRIALEELGPIYVKFGQLLSTRADLLPADIASELAKLQDQVPAFSSEKAKKIVEKSLGCKLEAVFQEFKMVPMASASIAQVHSATLLTGEQVVVKIRRPDLEKTIRHDVALLYSFARLADRYWTHSRRLKPREIVAEFERTIIDELDLMREAANASQLRRNFEHSKDLHIPKIYWDFCRRDVITMERVTGIPVSDIAQLQHLNIDLKVLAEKGVAIFFKQVFEHNFFHADMHPGNIFVNPNLSSNPQYIAVDFGIMGSLTESDQRYLAENLYAFFKRDYRRVAELHVESGWVPYDTRVDQFEAAIRTVCEPIFAKPLKDISFGNLLLRLFQTAKRFHMEVQPQLMLLQKTLLSIEGLGRRLYPELDLWEAAQPVLERWIKQRMGPKALLKQVRKRSPYWSEKLIMLPDLIQDNLALQNEQLQKLKHQQTRERNIVQKTSPKGFLTGLGSALLISSGLYYYISPPATESLAILNTGLFFIGLFSLLIGLLFRPVGES